MGTCSYEDERAANDEMAELVGWTGDATRCGACGETIWFVRGQQAAEVVMKSEDSGDGNAPHLLIHQECYDSTEMELA